MVMFRISCINYFFPCFILFSIIISGILYSQVVMPSEKFNNGQSHSNSKQGVDLQDLKHDLPLNDFTKLDNKGNPLASDVTKWSCVRDNISGLIWETKQPAGTGSVSDTNYTYTWSLQSNTASGNRQEYNNHCALKICDTNSFVEEINIQNLCGGTDWRIPTVSELMSIIRSRRYNSMYHQQYFPHNTASWYWTSSSQAGSSHAWAIYFYDGIVNNSDTNFRFHVRLVHSTQNMDSGNTLLSELASNDNQK